jgi:hypothetical protein
VFGRLNGGSNQPPPPEPDAFSHSVPTRKHFDLVLKLLRVVVAAPTPVHVHHRAEARTNPTCDRYALADHHARRRVG